MKVTSRYVRIWDHASGTMTTATMRHALRELTAPRYLLLPQHREGRHTYWTGEIYALSDGGRAVVRNDGSLEDEQGVRVRGLNRLANLTPLGDLCRGVDPPRDLPASWRLVRPESEAPDRRAA